MVGLLPKQCNCQLKVFAEPHAPQEPPLLEPTLQPLTAKRYRGVPATEITFPRQGVYQLQLQGKSKSKAGLKAFEFKFNVTVAAQAAASENLQPLLDVNQNISKGQSQGLPLWAIAAFGLVTVGVVVAIAQQVNRQ